MSTHIIKIYPHTHSLPQTLLVSQIVSYTETVTLQYVHLISLDQTKKIHRL